jgi:hypothetical protein
MNRISSHVVSTSKRLMTLGALAVVASVPAIAQSAEL